MRESLTGGTGFGLNRDFFLGKNATIGTYKIIDRPEVRRL
jgi:hypothetical protein